jgi:hypothetical protein
MKNLLITTFGEYNHLEHWLNGDRNFDVALVNYDYHEHPCNLIAKCVYLDSFHTFKYPGIYEMFADEATLLDYDYFFMPDEDIKLSCEDINKLFDKAKTLNLDLCCPSIEQSDESFPSWKLFIHEDTDFVATNFVEVMCPLFSRSALPKCLETFNKSHSGWGLDIVWPKLIGDNHNNIGVVHSIIAKHTRKISSGSLYPDLQRKRISPYSEKRKLMVEYSIAGFEPIAHV